MRLTNLLFKVTLSAMILTAPAMITAHTSDDDGATLSRDKKGPLPFFSSEVIKRFVDHPTVIAMRAFPLESHTTETHIAATAATTVTATTTTGATANATSIAVAATKSVAATTTVATTTGATTTVASTVATTTAAAKTIATSASARSAQLRRVINQASLIYTAMNLQNSGLDPKAFEYAWRGYYNLVRKGVIHKRSVLSICDFSQSSRSKRMYVIDVQHKKLLYQTYVAHGQNSGDEFASTFSNQPDSYMSSLGFYVTQRTYNGRNGLSLRLDGVDQGYNDKALKRNIVLHGAPYAGEKYMQDYGNLGTSLGCPALPSEVSNRIIRTVKDGSCLFIYHPTQQYLDNSTIIHGEFLP